MKALTLLALPFLFLPGKGGTTELAGAYVEKVMVQRDIDAGSELCAPDVRWHDPTAAIWGMPLAKGIAGWDKMSSTMKSFGIVEGRFDRRIEFSAGPFACYYGRFSSKGAQGGGMSEAPFMTVIEVREDRIVGRTDYGDYDQLFPAIQRTKEGELDPIVGVSNEYLQAYADSDFDTLHGLLDPKAVFQDPTGEVIGSGEATEGADAIKEMLTSTFAPFESFDIETKDRFYFQDHAVFAGTCSFTLPGAAVGLEQKSASFTFDLVVVLQIQDEKVVKHLDYGNYDGYIEQVRALAGKDEE